VPTLAQTAVPGAPDALLTLLAGYGPHAFGLVALLVMWLVIMRPELRARRAENKALERHIVSLEQISDQQLRTARINRRQTKALTALVERVERLAGKRDAA
jgi:hypothetical protein